MQLSIQAHAQQQADELVHDWGKQAHVQIGKVRYHLLRNGLILHDIHIRRGDDRVDITQILLRANPKLLTGSAPRIGMVDIFGLHADITHAGNASVWKHDPFLGQIWQAATALHLHDGNIALYMQGRDRPALKLHGLSLQQHLQSSLRSMTGSARTEHGELFWQWQQHTDAFRGAPARPTGLQSTATWLTKGSFNWHGLDAGRLLHALHLKATPGHLDGNLTWQTVAADNGRLPALDIRGRMQLNVSQDSGTSNAHHLQFSASATDGRWQADVEAVAWPLDPWSDVLPNIGAHQLISAQLDGKMHWQGQAGHWSVSSDQGLLQDVTYARPDSREQSAWYWSRIHYNHAVLDLAAHRLQFSTIDMRDSRLVLQMQQNNQNKPTLAGLPSGWRINADKIDIGNMMLALSLPQGQLSLAGLDGVVRCPEGKPLRFTLQTSAPAPASGSDADTTAPTWQLRGRAEKNIRGEAWASARLKVTGKHVPVARLRPLLALQDDADSPVKLTGVTDLGLTATIADHTWRIQGRASVHAARLEHGGNIWQSDQLDIRFGPVGPGLETQQIQRIESQNWQYIAALHPLSPHADEHVTNMDITSEDAANKGAAGKNAASENVIGENVIGKHATNKKAAAADTAWWVASMRRNHIAIHHLSLTDGRISVGQPQSVWARRVNLTADHIGAEQWTDLDLQGEVDGNPFYLKGQWQALSDAHRFRGDAGLDQATPFFLRNWMHASGMPSLIRGRLSASLHIADAKQPANSYQGKVKLQLLQGLAEPGLFTTDPMLARTGYATPLLLQRLGRNAGIIDLQYDLNGNWTTTPLTAARLGDSLLDAMRQAALHGPQHKKRALEKQPRPVSVAARIRLHDHERLSQNERNRLFKVVRLLRQHPEMIIDLRGRWTGEAISEQVLKRIRFTQQLIEDYISYRQIDKRRIFPLWPTAVDRADEAGSVQLETRVSG